MTDGRQEETIGFENAPRRQDTVSVSHGVEASPLIGDSSAQSRISLERSVWPCNRSAARSHQGDEISTGDLRPVGLSATPEILQPTVRSCESFLAEFNRILVTRFIGAAVPITFVEAKLLLDGSGRMMHHICHISEAST
jgi:hypothetical protein